MANILSRKATQSLYFYFAVTWSVAVVPSLVLVAAVTLLVTASPVDDAPAYIGTSLPIWRQLLENAVFVPVVESALLIFPTVVARSAIPNNNGAAALIGALPVSLLHAFVGWTKPLLVFWFFFVFAYAYLDLRNSRQPAHVAFLFVILGHALGNFLLTLASRIFA